MFLGKRIALGESHEPDNDQRTVYVSAIVVKSTNMQTPNAMGLPPMPMMMVMLPTVAWRIGWRMEMTHGMGLRLGKAVVVVREQKEKL